MTAAAATGARTTARPAPRRGRVYAAEWAKLRSWPAGRWLLLVALVLSVVASAGFVLSAPVTTGDGLESLSLADRRTIGLFGVDFANVTMIVFATLAVCGEMSSGLVGLTLQVTPRRTSALLAKVLTLLTVGAGVGIAATLLAYTTSWAIFAARGLETTAWTDPQLWRLLGGTMLMVPMHVVIAAALGYVFRSAALGFLAVFVVMCLPTLGGLLPDPLSRDVQWVLVSPALHTLSGASVPGDSDYTAPGAAVVVLVVWAGVLLLLAARTFGRRDF